MKFGMTKRKFKMKLPSRRNGTLVPDDDDSDSDLQEFPLPKKRIIKPGKSTYVARLDSSSACVSAREKARCYGRRCVVFYRVHSNSFSNVSDEDVVAVEFVRRFSSLCFS